MKKHITNTIFKRLADIAFWVFTGSVGLTVAVFMAYAMFKMY